jgi:hypothetical protein
MSDTPETDAAQHEGLLRTNPIPLQVVTAEFARKLEQERDEAREKAERYRLEANVMMLQRDEWAAMCGRYKQERDEAMKKYDALATEHMLVVNKLCEERDEARDQLIHLRSCVYDVIHSLKAGAFDELEKAWKEGLK